MSRIEQIGPPPPSNFHIGRDGNPVSLLVDHWMGTSGLGPGDLFASAVGRFMSPTSIVSAHYLVGSNGRIVQLVKDADTAFHAGSYPVNQLSIGIEHACSPTLAPTDALYAASAWLHATLRDRYGLALVVGDTVKPHRAIVPTQCPGSLDLARIVRESEEGMTDDELWAAIQRLYPGKVEELVKPTVRVMVERDPETQLAVRQAVAAKLTT